MSFISLQRQYLHDDLKEGKVKQALDNIVENCMEGTVTRNLNVTSNQVNVAENSGVTLARALLPHYSLQRVHYS